MDKYLTKDKVSVIIQNAPKGTSPEDVISGLVDRGYKLEGFNDKPVEEAPQGSNPRATFKATGEEGIIGGTAKSLGNVPSSALNLGEQVVSAVVNPIETAKAVKNLVAGAGAKIAEIGFENTDVGQSILQKMNNSRVARGLEPLKKDESGKLQGMDTPELQAFNQVGEYFANKYGGVDNLKKSVIEDPVGVLADAASVFTGSGAALRGTTIGAKATELASKVEPINAVSTVTGKTTGAIKDTTLGKSVSEIIPSRSDIQASQVTKALDLTQGDLATISKSTGNDVTDFITRNNLIKESPEAIADALNIRRKDTMSLVRDEISKVQTVYKTKELSDVQNGLKTIAQGVDGVAGLENVSKEISTLLKKKDMTLSDVQRAKELIDENSSIYSKIGDTKSSSAAKGLANIRGNIRAFIEKEVDTATNGATDINKLNNDVQTSFAIEDAINTRATRNLTRSGLSISDIGVLFGGGATLGPAIGVGLFVGKKVLETPSMRLGITKALSKRPLKEIKRIVSEVKNKNVSPTTQKMINELVKEAKKNLPVIESGSIIVEESKEQQKQ